jgi:hypothetical protein
MKKTLYLYIGAQKTASSMVRRALKAHIDQLNANGVALIDRGAILESPFFKLVKNYPTDGSAPDPNARQQADIARLLDHPHPVTLATSEGMFSSLHANDFFQNIAPGLAMMQRALPGYDIRVILYTRVQKGFLESCYTQFIQMGQAELTFDEFLGKGGVPHDLSWAKVCDDIAGIIGRDNLIVRPFEVIREMGSAGFVRDFLQILGLSEAQAAAFDLDAALAEGRAANRGFSQAAVDIARFTMPMLNPKQCKRMRKFLQENFSTEHYPRPSYFTPEEAAEIKAAHRDENARLFAEYIPGASAAEYGYV